MILLNKHDDLLLSDDSLRETKGKGAKYKSQPVVGTVITLAEEGIRSAGALWQSRE